MSSKIHAYLSFNGNCREAMTFYQSCLGGELSFQKVSESPMAASLPSEAGASILKSSLVNAHLVLLASDMRGESILGVSNRVSLYLICDTDQNISQYFKRLSEGGEVKMPLHQTFWGDRYGEFTDRYGIHWILHHSKTDLPRKSG